MTRLLDALERAHAVREQHRSSLAAEAPACALDEAPLPRFAEPLPAHDLIEPPMLEDEVADHEFPHRQSGRARMAITALAGLALAALFAWFLVTSHEGRRAPAKPSELKLDYQLPAKK